MKRVHLIISGDVVGVGYRTWAKRHARDLGIGGWVKNREDRTVELIVEGEMEALVTFIASCKKGPDVAWVKDVTVTWQDAIGEYVDFEVLY